MTDTLTVHPSRALRGKTTVPGDKSISHRAVLFNSLADGNSTVRGWLPAGDTLATLNAVQSLGIRVERPEPTTLIIHGGTYVPPTEPLNLVNAGTGIRLLAGIMAGQRFPSVLDGSEQLRRRPMRRITEPLRAMGACITDREGYAPLQFDPAPLHGIHYDMPIASAQVKSALLLAALFAQGSTTITQPGPARDHTERLLVAMGAQLEESDNCVTLTPGAPLRALDITVPGDFSSAAFLLVAASLLPGSHIRLTNISLNPTRTGLLDILLEMGANIIVEPEGTSGGDPVGTLVVQSAALHGTEIGGDSVVRMIDEFPALMIAALYAEGRTVVRDALELRVKETDRIAIMAGELRKLGAVVEEREDGFVIEGPQTLHGGTVLAHDDHRVAMSLALTGMLATDSVQIAGANCTHDSFPGFETTLRGLGAEIE